MKITNSQRVRDCVSRLVRPFRLASEGVEVASCDALRRLTHVLSFLGLPRCFMPSGRSYEHLKNYSKLVIDRRDVVAHLRYIGLRYWLWVVMFWTDVRVWYHWCLAWWKGGKVVADKFSHAMGRQNLWKWSWFPPNVQERTSLTGSGLQNSKEVKLP